MNRRYFLTLAVPALLPSCNTSKPAPARPQETVAAPPAPSRPQQPAAPRFRAGPIPARLPAGIPVSFNSCAANGPYLAMTFDDGPHASQTPRLLDMLRSWGITATFFLIGRNAAAHPGIVRRIVAEGHEVANHSWSHPKLGPMPDGAVRDELRRTHDAIVNACGVRPLVFRPPYGSITPAQKEWIAAEFGYPTIMWSVYPNDWKDRNSSLVSSRIVSRSGPGSIVLAHDIHATTVSAMPSTLPPLARRGLRFVSVTQLITLAANRGSVAAGLGNFFGTAWV